MGRAADNFSNNKRCSPVHLFVSELLQNILENCTGLEAEQTQPESGMGRGHGQPLHLDAGDLWAHCHLPVSLGRRGGRETPRAGR